MKNILMLTSGISGNSTANGICAKALAKELEKNSCCVYMVSVDYEIITKTESDKIKSVYLSPATFIHKKGKIRTATRLLKNIVFHSFSLKHNKKLAKALTDAAEEFFAEIDFDAVVCVFFPVEAAIVGGELKRRHPETALVLYELDSVADGIGKSGKYSAYLKNSSERTLKKLYEKCKLAMVMECHTPYWLSVFEEQREKLVVADLPLFRNIDMHHNEKEPGSQVRFLYAGTVDMYYRSPMSMLETFKVLDGIDWSMDFYSKGCDAQLKKFKEETKNVNLNGYVNQNILDSEIEKADFLLSVGNKVSNSLPSKIIAYMNYGKPIIHFCLQDDDICKQYLNKYPLSLVIEKDENAEVSAQKIVKFVEDNLGSNVSYEELCKIFPKNLPEYSAKAILDRIK